MTKQFKSKSTLENASRCFRLGRINAEKVLKEHAIFNDCNEFSMNVEWTNAKRNQFIATNSKGVVVSIDF